MYFITGATGLVGIAILKSLALQGKKIKVFHRSETDLSAINKIKGDIISIEGSLDDIPLLTEELREVHTIIHAAALVSFDPKDKKKLYQSNVIGTKSLVDSALISKVTNFIHISSVAAIGREKGNQTVTENTQWVESSLNSTYGKSKYLAELEVWRGYEEGLRGFILNPSIILGKGDWHRSSSKLIKFIHTHKKHYPKGTMNFVDLRDVRDVVLKLIDKDINGERFILNGGQCSYKQLFEEVSLLMNNNRLRKEVSMTTLKILQKLASLKSVLTNSASLLTKETLITLESPVEYDTSKIEKIIDHKFRNLQNTLEDIVPYYLDRYKL